MCEEPDHDVEVYKQCLLVKGNSRQISWLPVQFAKVGTVVKLKDDNGEWSNGWEVKEASSDTRSIRSKAMLLRNYKLKRRT